MTPRHGRLQLLVGRTAGAVPGALAGGAVGVGAGLSLVVTALLGTVGAALGAVAAAPDVRATGRRAVEPVDSEVTPPHGISVQP